MQQREITDEENVTWSCVQAYAGLGAGAAAEVAAERTGGDDGRVTVVCTPSGGAQTVRLQQPADWMEGTSDDALLAAIAAERRERGEG